MRKLAHARFVRHSISIVIILFICRSIYFLLAMRNQHIVEHVDSLVSGEDVQQRRLSRTRRAHNSGQLARPQSAADGLQDRLHIWKQDGFSLISFGIDVNYAQIMQMVASWSVIVSHLINVMQLYEIFDEYSISYINHGIPNSTAINK